MKKLDYNRTKLIETVMHHYPTATSGCECGGLQLGRSFPQHVADMYEAAMKKMRS